MKRVLEGVSDRLRLLKSCWRCNECWLGDEKVSLPCPPSNYYGYYSYSAGGRIIATEALLEGLISLKDISHLMYKCTLCGACAEICKNENIGGELKLIDFFEELRAEIVREGVHPPKYGELAERVEKNKNPYNGSPENKDALKGEATGRRRGCDVVYFVGCTSTFRRKEIAEATIKLLRRLNIDFTLLGSDEWCCGSPLFRTGFKRIAAKLARHNVLEIKKRKPSKVIFSCAGCYKTFKQDYPNIIGEEMDFEMQHISQFLSNKLSGSLINKVKVTVTYHDPCHLGRQLGVFNEPRDVLMKTADKLVEMKRNRNFSFCCGFGAGVRFAHEKLARRTASSRLAEAVETGADALVSTCPFCKTAFLEAGGNSEIKIYDLTEFVLKAITNKQ